MLTSCRAAFAETTADGSWFGQPSHFFLFFIFFLPFYYPGSERLVGRLSARRHRITISHAFSSSNLAAKSRCTHRTREACGDLPWGFAAATGRERRLWLVLSPYRSARAADHPNARSRCGRCGQLISSRSSRSVAVTLESTCRLCP